MDRRTFLQLVSATAVGGVLVNSTGVSARPRRPRGAGTEKIVLVENAWTASAINVAIAKKIIEDNLGNEVEVASVDENTMFSAIAAGDIDACLELWPSGIAPEEQQYLDDGDVLELGKLGAIGRIGWYVPRYVQEQFPATATWEGFLDPDLCKEFASAETGDLGRFLGTDPSYSQYDEQIIANLGLNLQVVYSGSEAATVAALDSAVASESPIVMYWWVPTAAAAAYDLVEVALPEYSDECYAADEGVACAYPEDVLIKVGFAGLADKDAAVANFLARFTMTNETQLSMLPAVEIEREDAADVAARWVEENEDTWSVWLEEGPPSTAPVEGGDDTTAATEAAATTEA